MTATPAPRGTLPPAWRDFLVRHGRGGSALHPLGGDASFRRYYRLGGEGDPALLMVAPAPHEDLGAYLRVAHHLRALGLSTPRVYASDEASGLALIEDFGDATFSRLLDAGGDPAPLYRLAVDLLVRLQTHPDVAALELPAYDLRTLLREATLFTQWYWPAATGEACPEAVVTAYRKAWEAAVCALPAPPMTLVVRDFHVDNLMRLPGRRGPAACGVLDFQDALRGHPAYDLVSLLEDARRDVALGLADEMRARYFAGRPELERAAFMDGYGVLGAQRHCKVAGIFVRLSRRDGKHGYLEHLPRVLGLLDRHLEEPPLAPVRQWFARYLPQRPIP